jgi:hypothetical protein
MVCGLGCTTLNLFTLPPRHEGTIRVRSVDLKATAIPAGHTGGSLFLFCVPTTDLYLLFSLSVLCSRLVSVCRSILSNVF